MKLAAGPFEFERVPMVHAHFVESLTVAKLLNPVEAKIAKSMGAFESHFVAGRLCAHRALHDLGNSKSTPIVRVPHRAPVWPKGFVGSVSHTRGFAVACAATTINHRGLGIDTERCDRDFQVGRATLFAHQSEIDLLRDHAPAFTNPYVYLLSLKECIYKTVYTATGERLRFHDAAFFEINPSDDHFVAQANVRSKACKRLRIHTKRFGEYFVSCSQLPA